MAKDPEEKGVFFAITMLPKGTKTPIELQQVLYQFDKIFAEPQWLPPIREIEHQIILKSGSEAKHQSPYKYSYSAKGKIEKIVEVKLKTGDSTKQKPICLTNDLG